MPLLDANLRGGDENELYRPRPETRVGEAGEVMAARRRDGGKGVVKLWPVALEFLALAVPSEYRLEGRCRVERSGSLSSVLEVSSGGAVYDELCDSCDKQLLRR